VVRDLAKECGKKVEINMEGQETELDKTLIEAIKDPLTHLVRNAVDHGIETPELRRARGKPEMGTLFLRAYHEGGQVNIEISDDGSGINPERVVQKAIDRSLISPQQASQLSPREILNLIFMPGFSTAERVTNISGRGVGMDVVKSNIEKINGNIDLQSELGRGTIFKIKIPLTLAIIPALIVQCAGDRYAIPQVSLVELVRLEGEDIGKRIELVQGAPVYRLRGNLLPLLYLHRELRLEEARPATTRDEALRAVNIVVLQADDRQFGVVVEGVNDTEEIVVKPLGKQLKELAVFAGATTMGDGKVALILDVLGLAQRAHVVSKRRERPTVEVAGQTAEQSGQRQTLLLFEGVQGERMALPLARVARLEKFTRAEVEQANHRQVVQYRGQIMAFAP
jgi:two-component system, chemotaxis family, sensor kinase CheA